MSSGERKRKRLNREEQSFRGLGLHLVQRMLTEQHGKADQRRWESCRWKRKLTSSIQSTAGHVKSRGKMGGPSSKPKYYLMTDSEKYCEGKVKSTPGGEWKRTWNPALTSCRSTFLVWLRTFCRTGQRVTLSSKVKHLRCGAVAKASLKWASSYPT